MEPKEQFLEWAAEKQIGILTDLAALWGISKRWVLAPRPPGLGPLAWYLPAVL